MENAANPFGHRWFQCPMCGPSVRCGKCGNNACNGGAGTVDGADCDACNSAYEKQNAEWPGFWHRAYLLAASLPPRAYYTARSFMQGRRPLYF